MRILFQVLIPATCASTEGYIVNECLKVSYQFKMISWVGINIVTIIIIIIAMTNKLNGLASNKRMMMMLSLPKTILILVAKSETENFCDEVAYACEMGSQMRNCSYALVETVLADSDYLQSYFVFAMPIWPKLKLKSRKCAFHKKAYLSSNS